MKTFNEEDLITWSNRNKAIIGNKYYFAHTLTGLQECIKNSSYIETLAEIDDDDINSPFNYHAEEGYICNFACILPVDAVKEIKLEKKYRACKDLRELYITIYDDSSPDLLSNEDIIYYLVRKTIKFRLKDGKTQYYECITGIVVYDNGDIGIEINCAQYSFKELFKCYEIEINGEWLPFGVLEND